MRVYLYSVERLRNIRGNLVNWDDNFICIPGEGVFQYRLETQIPENVDGIHYKVWHISVKPEILEDLERAVVRGHEVKSTDMHGKARIHSIKEIELPTETSKLLLGAKHHNDMSKKFLKKAAEKFSEPPIEMILQKS